MSTFWSILLLGAVAVASYALGHKEGNRNYDIELEKSHTLLHLENENLKLDIADLKGEKADEIGRQG